MQSKFLKLYGQEGNREIRSFFSPGRVNLIGEHTDYNGGHVFPCALSIGTYAMVRLRDDNMIGLYSESIENCQILRLEMGDLEYNEDHGWANYPKGVIREILSRGYKLNTGFDMYIWSTLPKASGLSSSASLEVLTAYILRTLFNLDIDMIDVAVLCKEVENNYIGVNCGILDQFAVSMGKKDHATLLDCNTLKYEYVPFKLDNISIVLAHTNKERSLIDSKYNERRSECETALSNMQKTIDVGSLGELDCMSFNNHSKGLEDTILRRARHAVTENIRTIKAKEALTKGDIGEFGRLMKESHMSLKDDYEVTGIELDTLADLAWRFDGCVGARMTGAGFGGCTVNLVLADRVEEFSNYLVDEYNKEMGFPCRIYVSDVGNGPIEIV